MKKAFLFFTLIASGTLVNAQGFTGPSPFGNYGTDGGIITFKNFPVRTSIGAAWGADNPLYADGYLGFNLAYDGTFPKPWTYNGGGEGGVIYLDGGGSMHFATKPAVGGNGGAISNNEFRNYVRMKITQDGKVIIGNIFSGIGTPGDYKLYVEKGILTERVRVAVNNSADWADYVFDKDYKMMSLPQLEKYIQQNKHLPDVPSAQDVVAQGVDLQKMDARLLQKVEELTLLMIQQQKEIDALKIKVETRE